MKISVGMLVVNGRPFIEAQLKNLYGLAHEIIICEGGDKFWFERHGYRRSTDGTIDIIKKFPDPQNKIKLIQKDWGTKNEMSHEFSKNMSGDIIYSVDLDEFMTPKQLITACQKLMNSMYTSITIPHYVFFGDFNTLLVMEHTPTWVQVPRIFRNRNSIINHLPMCYWTPKGLVDPIKMPHALIPNIYVYHYSWIYDKSVRDKIAYYDYRTPGCIVDNWLDNYFNDFPNKRASLIKNKTNVRPTEGPKQFLIDYKGPKPKFVEDILNDISILNASSNNL